MRLLRRIISNTCLGIGGTCLILTLVLASEALLRNQTPADKKESTDAALGFLIIGVPGSLLGGWLAYGLRQDTQKQERDRLMQIFYQLVQQQQGVLSVMDFAIASGLSGDQAKAYLDEQANEFTANFQTGEDATVYYRFPTGAANLTASFNQNPQSEPISDQIADSI
ncbi:hypothetical protein ACQ4M4_15530 [Leptolyngbya sp. AN02str]|uniref:hypothetical protein n=1 Tax=Leptolyngbya sp. AN02str TaxID=3423363 RepID=UPI003D31454F